MPTKQERNPLPLERVGVKLFVFVCLNVRPKGGGGSFAGISQSQRTFTYCSFIDAPQLISPEF